MTNIRTYRHRFAGRFTPRLRNNRTIANNEWNVRRISKWNPTTEMWGSRNIRGNVLRIPIVIILTVYILLL